jgi:hypothetical protein
LDGMHLIQQFKKPFHLHEYCDISSKVHILDNR